MKQILAIDIGGTNTKLAPVDRQGKLGLVKTIPTLAEGGPDGYLDSILDSAWQMMDGDVNRFIGIGIGVAGFIDPDHACMTFNPNISWLEGVQLKRKFSERFNLPTTLEVDSNAAAIAEYMIGNGRGSQRLLVLTIGTGLGGGMTISGNVLRITHECLGDIGHVMVEPGGPSCGSGCKGCAEAMVSAPALERYAEQLSIAQGDSPPLRLKTPEIIASARAGNESARGAIQKLGHYLGIALASMAPMLEPDCICIAGGVSEAGSELIDAAVKSFTHHTGRPYSKDVVIRKALLGWQSVLVGAAFSISLPA